MKSRLITVAAVLSMLGHGATLSDDLLTLKIRASGATPSNGQALLSIFSSKQSYMKQPFYEGMQSIGDDGATTFVVEGLQPGTYALNVIYDEDGDGELDTGMFGIPKEKIAFSNDARGRFGPPGFDETRFEMTDNLILDVNFIDVGK